MQEYLLFNLNYDSLRLLLIIIGVLLGVGIFLVIILLRRRQPVKVVHPPEFGWMFIELYPECPNCKMSTKDAHLNCPGCGTDVIKFTREIKSSDLAQYPTEKKTVNRMLPVLNSENRYLASIRKSENGEIAVFTDDDPTEK